MKFTKILFLILLFIGLIFSIILSFVPPETACGESQGCVIVQTSEYEKTLGIQNAYIGLIAFLTLIILFLIHEKKPTKLKKNLIATCLIAGSIFSLYFLYLQFFVINAICKYCIVTDIGVILALFIFLISNKQIQ